MIKITLAFLKKEKACEDGIRWFRQQDRRLLKDIVPALLADDKASYARWLLPRLMTPSQRVMWAVFAAEQVLNIFEKAYPKDDRPRKAIEAAKDFLAGKITEEEVKKAANMAWSAADVARSAADAANAANAAWSAANAANAAYADWSTAWSAAYAADAANAVNAACAAGKKIDEAVMNYGLKILGEI